MKLLPLKTVPLRMSLHMERHRVNQEIRRVQSSLSGGAVRGHEQPSLGNHYLAVRIHPYALIGHQIASWMTGYLWAQELGMRYLGGDLSRDANGLLALNLVQRTAPTKTRPVRLAAVSDERDPGSLVTLAERARRIIRDSSGPRVFRLALDQPRWSHAQAADALRCALMGGSRGTELRALEAGPAYVAMHVRRGPDISRETHAGRWIEERFYSDLITRLRLNPLISDTPIRVYALGEPSDFPRLSRLDGVSLHLNGDRDSDFAALASARLLIAAPSSFSFNAGLASRGAVMMISPWWHAIPSERRWVRMDVHGNFEQEKLTESLSGLA